MSGTSFEWVSSAFTPTHLQVVSNCVAVYLGASSGDGSPPDHYFHHGQFGSVLHPLSPKLLVASSAELRTQRLTLTCSISVADSVSSFVVSLWKTFLSLETHLSTHCPPPAPEDSVSLFANTPIIVSLQSKANKHTNQSSHSYFSTYLYWLPSSPSTDPLRPAVLSFVPACSSSCYLLHSCKHCKPAFHCLSLLPGIILKKGNHDNQDVCMFYLSVQPNTI